MSRSALLAGTAASLLLLGACGSGGDDPTSTGGAATSTSASGPSDPSSSEDFPTPSDTGKRFDRTKFTGRLERAVAANPTARIEVTATLPDGKAITAKGSQDLEQDDLDMSADLGDQQIEVRQVGKRSFLAQPPKWVEVSPDDGNPLVDQTLAQIKILSMKRQLRGFVDGVTAVGTKGSEDVDGAATTHFTAQVESDAVVKAVGIDRPADAPDVLLYDVWLDDDDLIRKMTFDLGSTTVELRADRWGEPVTITAPAGDDLATS